MKNITIFILGFLLVVSCNKITNSNQKSIQSQNSEITETNKLNKYDFKRKVFEIGSKTHFTDNCSFYFECDCCSGDLIFTSASTFYYIDYCISDKTMRTGTYNTINDKISLNFGGQVVSREYNYENEFDTSAIDFFMRDTLINSIKIDYLISLCDKKIKLIDEKYGDYAIETESNFEDIMNNLEKELFIEQFDKLTNEN